MTSTPDNREPPPCTGCGWRNRCWKCRLATKRQRGYLQAIAVQLGHRAAEELSRGEGYHRDLKGLTGWEAGQLIERFAPRITAPRALTEEEWKPSRRLVCACGAEKPREQILCLKCEVEASWAGSSPPRLSDRSPAQLMDHLERRGLDLPTLATRIHTFPSAVHAWTAQGVPCVWAAILSLDSLGVAIQPPDPPMLGAEFKTVRTGLGIGILGLATMTRHRPRLVYRWQLGERLIPRSVSILLRTVAADPAARLVLKIPSVKP